MCAATVADVAPLAFFFVVVQKFTNLVACRFIKAGKDVPLHIVGVWVRSNKPCAREHIPVCRNTDCSIVHMARIKSVSRINKSYFYFVVDCAEEELVAFFAAFSPVICHFLILQGELVKIFAAPFAIEIDACSEALESLFVQPLDAFDKCADVGSRDGA